MYKAPLGSNDVDCLYVQRKKNNYQQRWLR